MSPLALLLTLAAPRASAACSVTPVAPAADTVVGSSPTFVWSRSDDCPVARLRLSGHPFVSVDTQASPWSPVRHVALPEDTWDAWTGTLGAGTAYWRVEGRAADGAVTASGWRPLGVVVDLDDDGAGADDCDDADPAVHPGATEVPRDGVDQDCDGTDAARVSFCTSPASDVLVEEPFDTLDPSVWAFGDWTVGESPLDPAQVTAVDGHLVIALADVGGTWVGGELYRRDDVLYGQITACLAGPEASGSVGAVFLYAQHLDGAQEVHDEIDVELVDGAVQIGTFADWRVGVDGYEDGPRRRSAWWTPPEGTSTVDFHAYTIDWSPGEVKFWFDGVEMGSLEVSPAVALTPRFNHWTTTDWAEVLGPPAVSPLTVAADWLTEDDDADRDGFGAADDCDDHDPLVYPGAVEQCDGRRDDCDDAGWASDDGLATWTAADGAVTDLTGLLSSGTAATPVEVSLADDGALVLCAGTWYPRLRVTGADVRIEGVGAGDTVLSGGGVATPIAVEASAAVVEVGALTLTDGATFGALVTGTLSADGGTLTFSRDDVVTLRDVRVEGSAGSTAIEASYATLALVDSVITANETYWAVVAADSTVTCTTEDAADAGIWGNADVGILLLRLGSTAPSVRSEGCDWGEPASGDNLGEDVSFGGYTGAEYGDDATFTCTYDGTGCV